MLKISLGEVEFMLRKPIESDADIKAIITSAEAGLLFMEEVFIKYVFCDYNACCIVKFSCEVIEDVAGGFITMAIAV